MIIVVVSLVRVIDEQKGVSSTMPGGFSVDGIPDPSAGVKYSPKRAGSRRMVNARV